MYTSHHETPGWFIGLDRERRLAEALTEQSFRSHERHVFAPIYVGNHCINDCSYCGYRRGNRDIPRASLSPEEAANEARVLVARGVHRVLVLSGELPEHAFIDHFSECVSAVRGVSGIDWIGVEVAPISHDACLRIRRAGADAFIVFQETYDRDVYAQVHPSDGPKSDFDARIRSVSVAAQAGFEEIGLGVLFGLADPGVDTAEMISHGRTLRGAFPNIQLRFSFPRFRPSAGARLAKPIRPVTQRDLAEAIVDTRMHFPEDRLVLTARESIEFRLSVLGIVTDFGAGGSTSVGGYGARAVSGVSEQFSLCDQSPSQDFIAKLEQLGYLTA